MPNDTHIHKHVCGCGDYLVCSQDPDKCAVPDDYQCPTCELIELDHYTEQQSRSSTNTQEKPNERF